MNEQFFNGSLTLQNGINIFPSQDRAIEQALNELIRDVPARMALLTDTSGQLISFHGERGRIDVVALGALVAGDLAASQEIARLCGEYQDSQIVLREGRRLHTFIIEAGRFMVLLVQFSTEVPLGWARMLIQKAAARLAEIVATPPEFAESKDLGLDQTNLPDLFGEALDSLVRK